MRSCQRLLYWRVPVLLEKKIYCISSNVSPGNYWDLFEAGIYPRLRVLLRLFLPMISTYNVLSHWRDHLFMCTVIRIKLFWAQEEPKSSPSSSPSSSLYNYWRVSISIWNICLTGETILFRVHCHYDKIVWSKEAPKYSTVMVLNEAVR